ncbi:hypothetical protein [Mycobacterium sp. 141]|uniref:hypothetical protein n=1 Tax=Mycobacterium sp. 141 TaxID=1120797 RepID=UPI00035F789C|nr:hypothetical protein [Mycobacterium sp. 141]
MSDAADNRASPGRSDDHTRIIRRHPTGAIPTAADAEPATSLIGRPAGADPRAAGDAQAQTRYVPRARPVTIPRNSAGANPRSSVAAATASILSGWATAMIATDLIAGWWHSDRLFCVAIGFLTAISSAATISGLISLLLRRRTGPLLIVVGSIIGLLIFGSLFIAGAKLHPVVYAMPVLPAAAIVLTLLPSTRRWGAGPRS